MVWYINYHKTDKREKAGPSTEEGHIRPKCLGHPLRPPVLGFGPSIQHVFSDHPRTRPEGDGERSQAAAQPSGAGDDQEKLIREGLVAELLVMGTSVTCVLPRHLDGDEPRKTDSAGSRGRAACLVSVPCRSQHIDCHNQ